MLVATEGINATLAGSRASIEQYIAALRNDPRFADVQFKTSAWDKNTFPKLMVKVRPEIVTLSAGGQTMLTSREWPADAFTTLRVESHLNSDNSYVRLHSVRAESFGGGLPELRRELERRGVAEPLWVEVPKSRFAPKQA